MAFYYKDKINIYRVGARMLQKFKDMKLTREVKILIAVFATSGLATGLTSVTWNNFYDTYNITEAMRGALEIPRESPGLLLVFITGFLLFLGAVKVGAISRIAFGIGLLGAGFLAPTYPTMVGWIVLVSLGQHLYMPIEPTLAMQAAEEGREGTLFGRLRSVATSMTMVGAIIVLLVFQFIDVGYKVVFTMAAISLFASAIFLLTIKEKKVKRDKKLNLVFKKKYWLFYVLSLMSGLRKQLNLFIIPWLLIRTYNQSVQVFAIISIITYAVSAVFLPYIGRMIDKKGERYVLLAGSIMTLVVCAVYAGIIVATEGQASISIWILIVLLALMVVENLSLATGVARSIYVKRIAPPEDVTPTLSLGVSLDHFTAIPISFIAGLIWLKVGAEWIFVGAGIITVIYYGLCFFIPKDTKSLKAS